MRFMLDALRSAALCLVLPGFLPVGGAAAEPAAGQPFADGDVVAVLGDSITHGGRWHRYIADFYATRFPDRTVRFVNCGISGDSAGGALPRIAPDVLVHKPTAAIVMLGMNDVGRDSYKPGSDADPKAQAARARSLAAYRTNMTAVVDRLRQGGVRHLVLATPSPFDQTAQIAKENLPGVNDALAQCGGFIRDLAAKNGAGVADFNGPMTALNLERQRTDPAFTLVGADRVHPGAPGHLLMAWLFLKAQGAPAIVSELELDAAARRVTAARNARVTDLRWTTDGAAFQTLEKALPFPVDDDAAPALAWAPIEADLNREMLTVGNLPAGTHALAIDGTEVGRFTGAQLAAGINLALNSLTPQHRQAREMAALSEERRNAQVQLRAISYVEFKWFKPGEVDFTDSAATRAAIDRYLDNCKTKAPTLLGYMRSVADSYFKAKPTADAVRRQIDDLSARIHQTAQPRSHSYELRRVKD